MNELVVKQTNGVIDANFEEIKASLNEQLEVYRNMVFTEETKKVAKDTVAELRKGKKELSDRCKEVKKEYLIPLEQFMSKAEELAQMFDEPISFIHEQIDIFEKKRIEEKKVLVENIYLEMIPESDLQEIIPLTRIYNSKWENATFKEKDIKAEMLEVKEKVKTGIATIKSMNSEIEEKAIDMFKTSLDALSVVTFINNYEAQKREILEREKEKMRREEEERIRREERERIELELRHQEELNAVIEDAKEIAKEEIIEEVKDEIRNEITDSFIPEDVGEVKESPYTYTIFLTPDGKEKLEMFMNSIGAEFLCMEGFDA